MHLPKMETTSGNTQVWHKNTTLTTLGLPLTHLPGASTWLRQSPDAQRAIFRARRQLIALRRELQARHVVQTALHGGQVLPHLQVPRYDRVAAQAPLRGSRSVKSVRLRFPTSLRPAAGTYTSWWLMGGCVTHMTAGLGRGELEGPEEDRGHADPGWGPHLSMIRRRWLKVGVCAGQGHARTTGWLGSWDVHSELETDPCVCLEDAHYT